MSVFQLQEWWTVQASQTEEFDIGCMAVGNIDNANPATDKIVLGSHQGMLRIYAPTRPQYRVEDLYLEENLGQPILQILIGLFIPSVENLLGLAVLHPKKLVVYEVVGQGMRENKPASYYSLQKCYEHNLGLDGKHFTAYNMIHGPFGGVRGRDMIMVQSLDGKLQIFEQSANAFTRQLVDCLIPYPITYSSKLDSFVITNYACHAECYRYQVLASSQSDVGSGTSKGPVTTGAFNLTALRSALVEWTVNMGESCLQIIEGSFSGSDSTKSCGEVLALCEHSLFLIKASGGVMQQRKLERNPTCICPYGSSSKGKQNFLLADREGTIQVFSDFNLVWATKVSTPPVQLAVGCFGSQKGLVVTLDDTGRLVVGYLGTKPPVTSVVAHTRELDYDKVDEEHRSLLKIIRESQSDTKSEPKEKLYLRTQLSRTFDVDPVAVDLPRDVATLNVTGISNGGEHKYIKTCVRLYVSLTGSAAAADVSISVSTPSSVVAVPKSILLQKVSGAQATPMMVKIYFYANQQFLPTALDAQIVASYVSSNGEPRVSSQVLALPLHLFCRPKAAQKSALYKFTLDTEYPAQPLTDIFDDFLFAYQDIGLDVQETLGASAIQAMGFQFWAGAFKESASEKDKVAVAEERFGAASESSDAVVPAIVSILVSKTAGRYRVQSDSLAALNVIISELNRRINQRLLDLKNAMSEEPKDKRAPMLMTSCGDAIPLDEYFAMISSHFSIRQKINEFLSQLNDCAHQFRMIEKRLLVRFKDRNPTPLGGLDILMKETYKKLLSLGDSVQEHQSKLIYSSNDLSCATRLLVLLLGLKFGLSSAEAKLLENYFCVDIIDTPEQGWEESVDVSLTYLLKTALAKTAKENTTLTTTIEMPSDVENLKKRISMVIDRISKGAKPSVASAGPVSSASN